MRQKLTFLILIFTSLTLFSQDKDVKFEAYGPGVVEAGESFRLTFQVNASGKDFKAPSLSGFRVLAGPTYGRQQSYRTDSNGNMEQNLSVTYTYVIQIKKVGRFKIGSASIVVDGKKYNSKPITVEVVKGRANRAQNRNSGQQGNVQGISDRDMFIRVIPSKRTLYQGEHTVATIKLYSKYTSIQVTDFRAPSLKGFWNQKIEIQSNWARESYNNEVYYVVDIRKDVIYPQRNGKIVIPSAEMDLSVSVQQRHSAFDDFFGSTRTIAKTLKSKPVSINVKALPEDKPASFNGAVGAFKFSSKIDRQKVKTNEAITIKYTVSGKGNLNLISAPDINFPADFENYEPKVTDRIKNSLGGQTGSKTFEYLIIPRYGGNFKVPAVEFSYFDLKSKRYVTLTTPEYDIEVESSNDRGASQMVSGISKEDVKYLNKDILFIDTKNTKLKLSTDFIMGSTMLYLIYLFGIIILVVVFLLRKRYIESNKNIVLVKNRKANKMARKRLKVAAQYLKSAQKEQFYDETLKAIWGYLGDKLMIPVADLNKDRAKEKLIEKGVDSDLLYRFDDVVSTCEFARYAPSAQSSDMNTIYEKTADVISTIDQKIK
ncbi:MAG: BatD family protein [Bacteroidales bacterium]|jgi:hypothetical protein|nr:BatD family protein [Bacteroidales bacterium]